MDAEPMSCGGHAIHADVVARMKNASPADEDFAALSELFKLFGDQTRLRVMWALSHGEMCVCDLSVYLGMTKAAVSYQLKMLRLQRLVKYDKRGKEVYYTLADGHVGTIFREGFEHVHE